MSQASGRRPDPPASHLSFRRSPRACGARLAMNSPKFGRAAAASEAAGLRRRITGRGQCGLTWRYRSGNAYPSSQPPLWRAENRLATSLNGPSHPNRPGLKALRCRAINNRLQADKEPATANGFDEQGILHSLVFRLLAASPPARPHTRAYFDSRQPRSGERGSGRRQHHRGQRERRAGGCDIS